MDLLQNASHDELALAICFGAVFASGMLMYTSHHVARLTGRVRLHDAARKSRSQPWRAAQPIAQSRATVHDKAA